MFFIQLQLFGPDNLVSGYNNEICETKGKVEIKFKHPIRHNLEQFIYSACCVQLHHRIDSNCPRMVLCWNYHIYVCLSDKFPKIEN